MKLPIALSLFLQPCIWFFWHSEIVLFHTKFWLCSNFSQPFYILVSWWCNFFSWTPILVDSTSLFEAESLVQVFAQNRRQNWVILSLHFAQWYPTVFKFIKCKWCRRRPTSSSANFFSRNKINNQNWARLRESFPRESSTGQSKRCFVAMELPKKPKNSITWLKMCTAIFSIFIPCSVITQKLISENKMNQKVTNQSF